MYPNYTVRVPLTFTAGSDTSSQVDCDGKLLEALIIPTGWDTADITFEVSDNKDDAAGTITLRTLYGYNAVYGVGGVVENSHVAIHTDDFKSVRYFKVVSSVNQTENLTLYAVLRPEE